MNFLPRLPSLHSLHWKVFIFHLAVLFAPMLFVAFQVKSSLEKSYLHSTEAGMIDAAAVISELYARTIAENRDDPESLQKAFAELGRNLERTASLKGSIFHFADADVETYFVLYDGDGKIVFDSRPEPAPIGSDYARWRDVNLALQGRYGARWELLNDVGRVFLYSTLPVKLDRKTVGAVSVVKPTNRIRYFITSSLWKLAIPAFGAVLFASALAYVLSAYITHTVQDIAHRAGRVANGESNVRLETWTRSELGELARAIDRMRRKLEGKAYVEETVANLSHELKTPLAAIRGAAELLESIPPDQAETRAKFLSNIQTEVQRLDEIVGNMLMLARIESAPTADPVEPIFVKPVLQRVVDSFRPTAENFGVFLHLELPEGDPKIRIPEIYLSRMIGNLLHNALQHTPRGKNVRVRVTLNEKIVCIEIEDEGAGIEPEFLPKIWDRFFTTDNPRSGARGTGLGLAIVQSIAQTYRGGVSAESPPGRGAIFRVRFATGPG